MSRKIVIVHSCGTFTASGQVLEIEKKLPSYVKKLRGVMFLSPERIVAARSLQEIEASLTINNWKERIGNLLLPLGYNDIDDHKSNVFPVDRELIPNQTLSGYVKCLSYSADFEVKLYLICEGD